MKVLSFCSSSAVSSCLPGLIIFFITYHIQKLESAEFTVLGPAHPVTATVGQAIQLPCHLSPRMSAENMEVRWFRSEFFSFVHLYEDGKDEYEQQMPDYQGRTEFLKAGLAEGNVSLRILNVKPTDRGQYRCFVRDGTLYEEALLELKVAVLGSSPLISVQGHQDGGIRVVCQSAGWYPEPEVLWRDHIGHLLTPLSEAKSQVDNDLFRTESSIIMREKANQSLSCCIRNILLNQEKESTIYIADSFFPRASPWMVALIVILLVLFGFMGLIAYLFKLKGDRDTKIGKQHQEIIDRDRKIVDRDRKIGDRDTKIGKQHQEIIDRDRKIVDRDRKIVDRDRKIVDRDRKIVDRDRKIDKLQGELKWRRALLNAGWEKARQHAVDVMLDPDTAHPRLVLSEDRKRVRYGDTRQDLPDTPERFDYFPSVLGAEGFAGGRRYWEVEVGDNTMWDLGVCKESVSRKGKVTYSPEDGFWVVWLWDRGYEALTSPCTPLPVSARPSRVGVFLDYEAGEVSFYNVTDGSHLFTFTDTFSGMLRPYFYTGYNAAPLTICPVPAQAGGNPCP